MLISRSDRGLIANWWFSVDKVLLGCVLVLMASGVLFSMAASPPVAARLGLDHFTSSPASLCSSLRPQSCWW